MDSLSFESQHREHRDSGMQGGRFQSNMAFKRDEPKSKPVAGLEDLKYFIQSSK
jgi:hypothetical protein